MYVYKYPRLGLTPNQMDAAESYFEWQKKKEAKPEDVSSFREWCGEWVEKNLVAEPIREVLKSYVKTTYSVWDNEHKFPHDSISSNVAYWRKANQIHNWLVENLQDGVDDCAYHEEFSKEKVEELLDICNRIKNDCQFEDGEVENGYTYDDEGNKVYNYIDGKVMVNTDLAEDLLPTASGFFFGGTGYDEYYMEDINNTIDQLTTILETTDFDKEVLYYVSSW